MRQVPASVAVVTVAHRDPSLDMYVPMGIVVSSLTTVTLDPPTVSFNIKQPSQTLDAIQAAQGRFRVSWLASVPNSIKVIEKFAKGNNYKAYNERKELDIILPQHTQGSAAYAPPRLDQSYVRAAAECVLTQKIPVHDHVILVARINSLETVRSTGPSIAYVDGTYRGFSDDAGVLGRTQQRKGNDSKSDTGAALVGKLPFSRDRELSLAFDWLAIPGKDQRHQYADRLRSYFAMLQSGDITSESMMGRVQDETKALALSLGIDLPALVRECMGDKADDGQVVPKFYGILTTADIQHLADRVVQLVKADKHYLEMDYVDLLKSLDIYTGACSILPSDLLNPLRAEGLLPPFDSNTPSLSSGQNLSLTGHYEGLIRNTVRVTNTGSFLSNLEMPVDELFLRANVPASVAGFSEISLTRLKTETCKSINRGRAIDIAGKLSPEEARVVVRRVVSLLREPTQATRTIKNPTAPVVLKLVGVHPLVSGLNVDFILHVMRNLKPSLTTRSLFRQCLQHYFADEVTWTEFQSRIEQFIKTYPLRATSWSHHDCLAAMGLTKNTVIQTPLTETPNTINESGLFDMLMVNALKEYYGRGTDEENAAIAKYLKSSYGIDVTVERTEPSPQEAVQLSSAEDIKAAMERHRAEQVPIQPMSL